MPSWTNATGLPPDLPRPPTAQPGGLLRPAEAQRHIQVVRTAPPAELAPWVEHLWSVRWDLPRGASFTTQVLTHPAVHLTVEWGLPDRYGMAMPAALLHGVVTRRFDIDLVGRGGVIGVRFRPGGFGAFCGRPVAEWTDRVVALPDVFGTGATELTAAVTAAEETEEQGRLVTDFLAARRPPPDPTYDEVLAVVTAMLEDRTLTTVQAVTDATGLPVRTLQRLFRRYVGVGPKWVLQRYRLQDAVEAIDEGGVDDLAALAAGLGWYDQSHFHRDFTSTVGVAPGRYLADARATATATG